MLVQCCIWGRVCLTVRSSTCVPHVVNNTCSPSFHATHTCRGERGGGRGRGGRREKGEGEKGEGRRKRGREGEEGRWGGSERRERGRKRKEGREGGKGVEEEREGEGGGGGVHENGRREEKKTGGEERREANMRGRVNKEEAYCGSKHDLTKKPYYVYT